MSNPFQDSATPVERRAKGVFNYYMDLSTGRTPAQEALSSQQVIERLQAGLPYSELESLQKFLGLPMSRVAANVGLSRATLQRRKKNAELLTKAESDRVARLARLLAKAVEVLESKGQAREWMKTPQSGLGGAVPLDYADTDVGAREVENLLGRIEHGVFS